MLNADTNPYVLFAVPVISAINLFNVIELLDRTHLKLVVLKRKKEERKKKDCDCGQFFVFMHSR